MSVDISNVVLWVGWIVGIGGGVFGLFSRIARARLDELKELAQIRAEKIDHLETLLTEYDEKVQSYMLRVENLEGRLATIQTIKAQEIAEIVWARMALELPRVINDSHATFHEE